MSTTEPTTTKSTWRRISLGGILVYTAVICLLIIWKMIPDAYDLPLLKDPKLDLILKDTCAGHNITKAYGTIDFNQAWVTFPDVLLIILFNYPKYGAIPYLELLYRPLFPNIVYCGDSPATKPQEDLLKHFPVQFLYFPKLQGHRRGTLNYMCIMLAMKLNFTVRGYLAIADDILLDVRTLHGLDRQRIWIPNNPEMMGPSDIKQMKLCNKSSVASDVSRCSPNGFWIGLYRYQRGMQRWLNAIHGGTRKTFRRCSENLIMKTGGKSRVYLANADFYYIPKRFAADALLLLDVFYRARVYLEVAVPTVLRCLAPEEDITKLPMYWEDLIHHSYGLPQDYKKYAIIHKAKWAYLQYYQVNATRDYCDIALPLVHGLIPTFMSP